MRSKTLLACLSIFLLIAFFAPEAAMAESGNNDPRVKAAFDRAWALMSQMHKDLGNLDLAADQYREVLAIYPDNAEAMWKLSEVIFKKGEALKDKKRKKELFDQSMMWAEKSMALAPKKAEPHFWVGVNSAMMADLTGVLKAMNLVKRAKSELYKTIAADPKNRFAPLAKSVLAAIYLDSPWPLRDLDKAEDLARQAAAEAPDLTFASLTLGRVYAKQGKTEPAKKELNRCLSTSRPTYVWDSILYDWPSAKRALGEIK